MLPSPVTEYPCWYRSGHGNLQNCGICKILKGAILTLFYKTFLQNHKQLYYLNAQIQENCRTMDRTYLFLQNLNFPNTYLLYFVNFHGHYGTQDINVANHRSEECKFRLKTAEHNFYLDISKPVFDSSANVTCA